MAVSTNAGASHHISGLYTQMLMKPTIEELSPGAAQDILQRAGEARSIKELCY
jgi:hypothetical protein